MIAWHGALGHVVHKELFVSCAVLFILLSQLITKATLNHNSQASVRLCLFLLSSGTSSYSPGFRNYQNPHVLLMAAYLQPSSHQLDYLPGFIMHVAWWSGTSKSISSVSETIIYLEKS